MYSKRVLFGLAALLIACYLSFLQITVIEEAIKYIDELHVALAKRMHLLSGLSPGYLPYQITPNMLAPVFPFPQPQARAAAPKPIAKPLQLSGLCNSERRR